MRLSHYFVTSPDAKLRKIMSDLFETEQRVFLKYYSQGHQLMSLGGWGCEKWNEKIGKNWKIKNERGKGKLTLKG
jgi:hypothetical protein